MTRAAALVPALWFIALRPPHASFQILVPEERGSAERHRRGPTRLGDLTRFIYARRHRGRTRKHPHLGRPPPQTRSHHRAPARRPRPAHAGGRARRPGRGDPRAAAGRPGGGYAAHPERFVRRPPEPLTPPTAAWINPPKPAAHTEAAHSMRHVGVSRLLTSSAPRGDHAEDSHGPKPDLVNVKLEGRPRRDVGRWVGRFLVRGRLDTRRSPAPSRFDGCQARRSGGKYLLGAPTFRRRSAELPPGP